MRRTGPPLAVAAAFSERPADERPAVTSRADALDAPLEVAAPVVVGGDDLPADPLA